MGDQFKYIKTAVLLTMVFTQGLLLNSFNASVNDLTEMLKTTLDIVSIGFSVRCIGVCIGSLASSLLFRYFDRLFICSLAVIIEGILLALAGNLRSVYLFYTIKLFIGIVYGSVENGVYLIIPEIWTDRAKPFIQSAELFRTFAYVLTPLLFKPFLSEPLSNMQLSMNSTEIINSTLIENLKIKIEPVNNTRIWLPFAIAGILLTVVSNIGIMISCYGTKQEKNASKNNQNEKHSDQKPKKSIDESSITYCNEKNFPTVTNIVLKSYDHSIIIISCVLTFTQTAVQFAFFQFWVTYAMNTKLEISKQAAVTMQSVFAAFLMFGSLFCIFLSRKIQPLKLLSIIYSCAFLGNVILFIFSNTSLIMVWIGGCLTTFGMAGSISTLITCLKERINYTNFIGAIIVFSSNISTAIGFPIVIGYYIKKTPLILILMNTSSHVVMLSLVAIIFILDSWKSRQINEIIKKSISKKHSMKEEEAAASAAKVLSTCV